MSCLLKLLLNNANISFFKSRQDVPFLVLGHIHYILHGSRDTYVYGIKLSRGTDNENLLSRNHTDSERDGRSVCSGRPLNTRGPGYAIAN